MGEKAGAGDDAVTIPGYGLEWSIYQPCKVPSFKYAYITGEPGTRAPVLESVLKSVKSTSSERSIVSSMDWSSGRLRGFSCDC